jgi:hypothetical protein
MAEKFVLKGELARLPVSEVIGLLAQQEAASEAAARGEPPVFEQGAVRLDIDDESGQYWHSFDVRILKAEREWSSLIAQALTSRALVVCNSKGRPAPHLGIELGLLSVAAVAQWLANGGADVELDGVRVAKVEPAPTVVAELQPTPVTEPGSAAVVELGGRMKKAVLIAKHRPCWSKVENDLKEATREGHWLAPARLDRGHYDECVAVELARERGRYMDISYPFIIHKQQR